MGLHHEINVAARGPVTMAETIDGMHRMRRFTSAAEARAWCVAPPAA